MQNSTYISFDMYNIYTVNTNTVTPCTQTWSKTRTHSYIVYEHSFIHTYTNRFTNRHKDIHTYALAHIHTHTQKHADGIKGLNIHPTRKKFY